MMPVKQESSSQIVPFLGYSPIPVNNRFNPLSQPSLHPNYQSALTSNYDPFIVNPHASVPSPNQNPVKRSNNATRSHCHLFVVESNLEDLCDPVKIAMKFFPPNLHYFPSHPSKSIKFYRDILYETQSIDIRPIKDKETNATMFHSLYIRQILMPHIWSRNPYDQLPLQSGLTFNYVKWWDKFGIERIIQQVNIEFPPLQAPIHLVKDTSHSGSNASLQGKSKKDLKELAEQILAQVTQMNDEDSDDASPKSESASSQQPSQLPFSQKPKHIWSDYAPTVRILMI
ncbi:hypothetical protein L3X38_003723 [Prunus dulcis]|uniref:Uncharacterized protein n=1 Tax=Prunus dulcis TaxID=3755 RepID=A0AAD4ZMM9_PRUDU|nr:hypothetical protein L3X38_003723 [Prunus dulcis]